jgi:predicted TIM-barrel fold metal-dependent hydrolase
MGVVDIWCNLFTREAFNKYWFGTPEIAVNIEWWNMRDRIVGRSPSDFVAHMDASDVDLILIPSVKMRSYETSQLIWNTPEEEVADLVAASPARIRGLVGLDPTTGMRGVRRFEKWICSGYFVGAHIHTYGFGVELDHRRYYPFYAKCVELQVPVVMQVGHSAERMPSAMARPILLDNLALDFPELKIVGTHTGWPWVEEMIAMAWKHTNVYVGTSAHHPRYWDPSLVRFASSRGKGKVLYGTDYPVLDFADSLAAIDRLDLKDDARRLLVGDAARRVFDLDELPSLGIRP